ncbi:methyltransferase domain-containing protein [Micromonospora chaiyaphumensis]|uniref:Ubiquinone/menaquinone biosynthesis C-methylase UbiE n=1 Tax=Micromonospora chaiyaphumensis TaxID=307119 RepID=A0A1C4WCB1_9ACTN|nr:methyltransferase domain-containing protein [Micromonospora chaiyaphumensis]SCE93838.1 Ubiquinone/menaquinone biosynthesis C-methylase UbiE [Micromonospora chaiyaphumensis]
MSEDTMDATPGLVARLDAAETEAGVVRLRHRSYELLDLSPGASVVDVGCGTGRAVAELHQRGAAAIGVDPDELMIATARRRWPGADFRMGSAESLPLPDQAVSGYRADKVLHVLPDPSAALAEAHRVLTPGGRIVLVGQDWDALMIDSSHPELTRAILRSQADSLPNPQVARSYRNLLLDAGFQDVAVEAHTSIFTEPGFLPMVEAFAAKADAAGSVTVEQSGAWLREQQFRAAMGRLFVAVPMMVASARRS